MEMESCNTEDKAPLLGDIITYTNRKLSKKMKVILFLLVVAAIAVVILVAVVLNKSRSSTECVVPVYDKQGITSNRSLSSCSVAMEKVMGSQYLPESDLYSNTLNRMKIFKPLPDRCFISKESRKTKQSIDAYKTVDVFYRKVASDTGIALDLLGKASMGATLNIKTESLSAGSTEVMGSSVEILTYTRSISIDQSCFKGANGELTDEILYDFDNLATIIRDPWSTESWKMYDVFLKKYGSHFTSQVILGSSIRQWTFAKISKSYSIESLRIKTCLDLFGLEFLLPLEFDACNKYIKEAKESHLNISASSNLEIRGGTDSTRNKLAIKRTPALIRKLLDEGRQMESPIAFKYIPIWDIFLMKYGQDKRRYKIALNMKQYYEGLIDFGCSLIEISGIKARRFKYRSDDSKLPIFQCQLYAEGCHSDSDCHIGPSLSVTYCYGSTCLEHVGPSFGVKAKSVVARNSRHGSYDEGINRSCKYEVGITAGCYNQFSDRIIWDGSAH